MEYRASGFVKGESKKLTIVEYLSTAITPCNIKIFIGTSY